MLSQSLSVDPPRQRGIISRVAQCSTSTFLFVPTSRFGVSLGGRRARPISWDMYPYTLAVVISDRVLMDSGV